MLERTIFTFLGVVVAMASGYACGAIRWHWRMKRLVHELIDREGKAKEALVFWKNQLYYWLEDHAKDSSALATELDKMTEMSPEADYQRGKSSAFRVVLLHFRGWI